MTIHITETTNLVATWNGPYMVIPQEDDILIVDNSFYRIRCRIFTKKDVRLEVARIEANHELDKKIFQFQNTL